MRLSFISSHFSSVWNERSMSSTKNTQIYLSFDSETWEFLRRKGVLNMKNMKMETGCDHICRHCHETYKDVNGSHRIWSRSNETLPWTVDEVNTGRERIKLSPFTEYLPEVVLHGRDASFRLLNRMSSMMEDGGCPWVINAFSDNRPGVGSWTVRWIWTGHAPDRSDPHSGFDPFT